jgi:hypothetical protein
MTTQLTDRVYAYGGADDSAGNYPRQQGVASRLLRALCAHRGKWPGGRGESFGSRLHEVRNVNPEGLASVRSAIDEAWADFVAAQEIADVEIRVDSPFSGQAQFVATYTDLTTGERPDLVLPVVPEVTT